MDFDFQASLINTNPSSSSQSLEEIMGMLLSPIALQAGLIDAEGIYKIVADVIKDKKIDPNRYLKYPAFDVDTRKLTAEEVISFIIKGMEPEGRPLEPVDQHLQKLMDFQQSDDFGYVSGKEQVWATYIQKIQGLLQEQQQQQQMAQAAGQFQQGQGQGADGAAPGRAPAGAADNPPVQSGELLDESLPGAGGGGSAG